MIKTFKSYNESIKDGITYNGPIDYYDVSCIEALHNGKRIGFVEFIYDKTQKIPYHELTKVDKEFRGEEYGNIAFKLKMMGIGVNEKHRYYTKDLSGSGRGFVERFERLGYWKLSDYIVNGEKKGEMLTLTEKGKSTTKEYCKRYLGIDINFNIQNESKKIDFDFDKIDIKESDYLYVDSSQIPNSGKGLYTAIDIEKGEIISKYIGKILSDREAKTISERGEDNYFMMLPSGKTLDCRNTKCFAKYANDSHGTEFKNNSFISMNDEGDVVLVAKTKIGEGEEIFVGYGKEYWEKHK